jgi:hypothetical protein
MGARVAGAHTGLHSDQGARQGEHPGRSRDPIIKVHDIAWLEFEKPDLVRAEAFSRAFGFSTAVRTADELYLRGTDPGLPCVLIQRGPRSRFVAAAYAAQDQSDVLRLAEAIGTRMRALPGSLGGVAVDLVDPCGVTVRVVHGTHQLEALTAQTLHQYNFGHELARINTTQRPPREPTRNLFVHACRSAGITQSMGRTGSALDNAVSESFNSTLEFELLSRHHFVTREQARRAVAAFIDEYNTDRRHSTNGMLSPVDYEHACATQRATEQGMEGHRGRSAA